MLRIISTIKLLLSTIHHVSINYNNNKFLKDPLIDRIGPAFSKFLQHVCMYLYVYIYHLYLKRVTLNNNQTNLPPSLWNSKQLLQLKNIDRIIWKLQLK